MASRAVALALVVAVSATETDAAARRRNQKFWKSRQRDRNSNSDDDFFRSSDGDLVYVGKGAAAGHQVNMGFKFPTRPTTVSGPTSTEMGHKVGPRLRESRVLAPSCRGMRVHAT